MSDWLEKYHSGQKKLHYIKWYLSHLADILYEVGNDKIASRINRIHSDLLEATMEIEEAVTQNLDEQYRQAQESSANVLKACLSGVKLAENKNENTSD